MTADVASAVLLSRGLGVRYTSSRPQLEATSGAAEELHVPLSAFSDKAHQPNDEDLRATLGAAYPAWAELLSEVSSRIPTLTQLWGFASKSTGWGLRLRHKERVIVYMTPAEGHFLVSFVLGEKAVTQAHAARLPKGILCAIDSAPRFAEGRGFRIPVKQVTQIAPLATLAQIKNEN